MTLPTDPTPSGGGPEIIVPATASPASLAGIRELISLVRELIDRIEDRVEQLAHASGKE
jgi:hypothetical protein